MGPGPGVVTAFGPIFSLGAAMSQPPKPTPPPINIEYPGVFYHYFGPKPNKRWVKFDQIAWATLVFLFLAAYIAEWCWIFSRAGAGLP